MRCKYGMKLEGQFYRWMKEVQHDPVQQHCSVSGSLALISLMLSITLLPTALCFPYYIYMQWVLTYMSLSSGSKCNHCKQVIDKPVNQCGYHFVIGVDPLIKSSNQELQTKYNFCCSTCSLDPGHKCFTECDN